MAQVAELAAQSKGSGIPVLIIHGWEMAGFAEAHDLEPAFAKRPGYRRIYVDLPGMGSSPADGVKSLDDMLDRISAFIDSQILPSHFLLTGTSAGAYFVRALAFKYASAVDGLLLRVPVVEPANEKRDVDPFTPVIANGANLARLSTADRELIGDIPVQTPEFVDCVRRKFDATVKPSLAASDNAELDPIREDPERYKLTTAMHTAATPFLKPALILTGRQDTVVGYRDAWSLAQSYPRATFVALDRGDHGLPIDEQDLFESLICNWLYRVEETRRAIS